ncbi:tetratricopeptide repeat protein [Aquisphaera insulae]|uniref:tetratricopeptide repeat protein n=1 Tax=Aquisphaera insulae TaxID=2712864 RepID=UPI0013ED6F31|nr:tetratricopeptide repeat protein [Aquisphaera insulae]
MNRPYRIDPGLITCVTLLAVVAGCDYSSRQIEEPSTGTFNPGVGPLPSKPRNVDAAGPRERADRVAILGSSIELIQNSVLRPGGDNFGRATKQLNQFFEGTPATSYALEENARAYLAEQLPPHMLQDLESPSWSPRGDARHLEDCMLYSSVAGRVAGTGDDLERVRRVFDWVVEQVQLVPAGWLGSRQLPQVPARPYDVVLRGMGTESEGFWSERAWLFMELCRQLDIDTGLLTYTRGNILGPRARAQAGSAEAATQAASRPAVPWACAALINGKAYLFDARLGMPIPGPSGVGVATLEDAMSDASILERMDLPGQFAYGTSRASLLSSPTKIGVLIDSSKGYFSPKMKLLQSELAGKNRTILYRNPAEQRDHFAKVLGARLGDVKLWVTPLQVEQELFTNAQFVESTKQSLTFFSSEFPLIYARIKQLRGDLEGALQDYISFRLMSDIPLISERNKARNAAGKQEPVKTIPQPIQQGLDLYATVNMALAQLERKNLIAARDMFEQVLTMAPEPDPSKPFYVAFRWGASANLGRIYEALGDERQAIRHYAMTGVSDPTWQRHGNLLRARDLVFRHPFSADSPAAGTTAR